MALYRTYSDYLKEKYNEKVYKIPIALPVTCPNRDGTLDSDGCIFCGSIRADYETKAVGMEITRQIDRSISHVGPKYKAKKFIDIVGLAVSTRPDCIHESYLEVLREAQGKYGTNITVELGLQSVNPHTLLKIGRCHTVAEFIDAALQIGRYHFDLCAHIIADLPWDDRIDVEEAAKLVSVLPVTEIKIHSLYIIKGTKLAKMYEKGDIKLLPPEEYAERVVLILSMLRPDIVVQRIVGRASANTLSVNGGRPWWEVKEYIEKLMRNRHIQQGSACNYLHGAAVRRFLHE